MRHPFVWHARIAVLTLFAGALVGGCGQEEEQGSLEPPSPPPPPQLATVLLRPASAHLALVGPGNLVQLYATALDGDGAPLDSTTVTFSSSSPAIAAVSSAGVVTAVAPGTAEITATMTVGGVTGSASMVATVHPPDSAAAGTPDASGLYTLSALITRSDPAWGIPDGTTQTAVLTLDQAPGAPEVTGTFKDLRASGTAAGFPGASGTVSGYVNPNGWIVIELFLESGQGAYWHGEGVFEAGRIAGNYGCCGHISGSFNAVREPPPGQPGGQTRLRVVHAAGFADLDVRVDNAGVLNDLTYLTVSQYVDLPAMSQRATFALSNGWAGGETSVWLFQGRDHTAIVGGSAAWGAEVAMLVDDNRAPAPGKAKVRLFNQYGTLDFYLTVPDAELVSEKPTSTLGGSETSPYMEMPAGEYRLRATEVGTTHVVFDSGTRRFRAGQVRSLITLEVESSTAPTLLVLEDASY